MTKSRMDQSNYYRQMMGQHDVGPQQQQYQMSRQRENDENVNPYMQDSGYRSQVYEGRR